MPVLVKCPHCNVSHVQAEDRFLETLDAKSAGVFWRVMRCQNPECRKLVLGTTNPQHVILSIYPHGSYDLPLDVPMPDELRQDFREGGLALAAGCPKASMVMTRRALQRCLKEQGSAQRNLVDAITDALSKGTLRKAFHPLAEEIRQYGNLSAHPDDDQLQNATGDSATAVLEFVRLLIHEFYEVPMAAEKLRLARKP